MLEAAFPMAFVIAPFMAYPALELVIDNVPGPLLIMLPLLNVPFS